MQISEKNLLLFIKIVPIIVIATFSIITTYFAIDKQTKDFEQKRNSLQSELTQSAKDRSKEEVLRVVQMIDFHIKNTEDELKKLIKQRVNEAYTIAQNIYNNNKELSEDELKKLIKDALRDIRFNNGRGYYFIYEMSAKNVLLPPNPELEGKDFSNFKDAKGVHTIVEMAKLAKENQESFYTWWWYKPNDTTQQYKKIGFSRYFEPFDWFIGTGEYVQDFENDIKQQMIQNINQIRYGKNGYIFVFDYDGINVCHINPEYVGKNRIDIEDVNGFKIAQEIIKSAQNGGGFIQYIGTIQPTTGKPSEKISYVKNFDRWRWAVGSGAYLNDIDSIVDKNTKELKKFYEDELNRIIFFSIFLTIVFTILSLILSKIIHDGFNKYRIQAQKANKQLIEQAKLADMGEMIGNIAHQWRQPLSVISTASSGLKLKNEFGMLKENDIEEACDQINLNAQYLSQTIDDFRNFLRGDEFVTKFTLQQVIDRFIALTQGSVKNNNIELIITNTQNTELYGYPNQLIQCLINVFNNAKDALNNLDSNKLCEINFSVDEKNCTITITDNAGGIEENIIDKVFEPYFTTKHKSQGTGLGLSMVYRLIQGMHGIIDASNVEVDHDDQLYTGAQFTIIIPLNTEKV